MHSRHHSFLERQSSQLLFLIVIFEDIVMAYYTPRHQPEHTTKMSIPTLRYSAGTLILARLVYGRIDPRIGNEFFMIFKLFYVPPARKVVPVPLLIPSTDVIIARSSTNKELQ